MMTSKSIRILIVSILGAAYHLHCEAFSFPQSIGRGDIRLSRHTPPRMVASHNVDENRRTQSDVVVISKPEDYVKFLEEDDRLCVVKFYAAWCKSCAKFGIKYTKLAHDYRDKVRFAEVEYNMNNMLCKTLKVRSLPTVHMHKNGKGKVAQMTKRPSEFQDVIDEIDRLLSSTESEEDTESETYTMNLDDRTDSMQFEQAMKDGSSLSEEIMSKIKLQEREEKARKAAKENQRSWFTFPFTF